MTSIDAKPADLIAAYRNGPAALRAAVTGMDGGSLVARPIAGKMSSLEVLCHVVDSDQFMCDRIKRTIATPKPLVMGVESADYPGPLHYDERDPELDLRLLETQREQLAADLDRLEPAAWERVCVHSENGLMTLRETLHHAVDHLEAHVETIHAKRRALGL